MILLTGTNGYAQFLTVLVVFVIVLGITAWVTAWMANYQKQQGASRNIEVLETTRIANNKYILLVRIGESYKVIAVCRDTVTLLGDVTGEQLNFADSAGGRSFAELFEKVLKKDSDNNE